MLRITKDKIHYEIYLHFGLNKLCVDSWLEGSNTYMRHTAPITSEEVYKLIDWNSNEGALWRMMCDHLKLRLRVKEALRKSTEESLNNLKEYIKFF